MRRTCPSSALSREQLNVRRGLWGHGRTDRPAGSKRIGFLPAPAGLTAPRAARVRRWWRSRSRLPSNLCRYRCRCPCLSCRPSCTDRATCRPRQWCSTSWSSRRSSADSCRHRPGTCTCWFRWCWNCPSSGFRGRHNSNRRSRSYSSSRRSRPAQVRRSSRWSQPCTCRLRPN